MKFPIYPFGYKSKFQFQISNNFLFVLFVLLFAFFFGGRVWADSGVAPSQGVEYELPYPGVLPDSSFYFLKVVRDTVVEFFISDPLKRSEYDLLQADKRVAAAQRLMGEGSGKRVLAEETFSKGLRYFGDAIVRAQEARRQGMDIRGLVYRMSLSNRKHVEVLRDLEKRQGGRNFVRFRERVSAIGIRVKALDK